MPASMLEISYGWVQINSAWFMDKNRQMYFSFSVAFFPFCVFFSVTNLFLGHSFGCPPLMCFLFVRALYQTHSIPLFFILHKLHSAIVVTYLGHLAAGCSLASNVISLNSTVEQTLFGIQCIFMKIFHVLLSAWKLAATSLHSIPEQMVWMCCLLQDKLIVDHYSQSLNRWNKDVVMKRMWHLRNKLSLWNWKSFCPKAIRR